jgi:hypothetical protein
VGAQIRKVLLWFVLLLTLLLSLTAADVIIAERIECFPLIIFKVLVDLYLITCSLILLEGGKGSKSKTKPEQQTL